MNKKSIKLNVLNTPKPERLTWPDLKKGQWFIWDFKLKNIESGNESFRMEFLNYRTYEGYTGLDGMEVLNGAITNTGLKAVPIEIVSMDIRRLDV